MRWLVESAQPVRRLAQHCRARAAAQDAQDREEREGGEGGEHEPHPLGLRPELLELLTIHTLL
eukprot:scaffold204807_cov24-Tisochrysis_lutea.AAC.1